MTTTNVDRIVAAATALSHRDLPDALQEETAAYLDAIAKGLPRRDVQGAVESALLLIASYGTVPALDTAGDETRMMATFGIVTNMERRAAVNDPACPLCLPLRLWGFLRELERRQREQDGAPKPAGGYSIAERLMFMAGPIELPEEYRAWVYSGASRQVIEAWGARRAEAA